MGKSGFGRFHLASFPQPVGAAFCRRTVGVYRFRHGRDKCSLPYMREQEVSDRVGKVLKDIYVPETVAETIVSSLDSDRARADSERQKRT